jgi:carboxymethylenebutenolidase
MSSETIALTAEDGHVLNAFVAQPTVVPKGGLIILQEIFGLTGHIKAIAEKFAAAGYLAVAPAMFDRIKPDMVLSYTDFTTARAAMSQLDRAKCVLDMKAAADYARSAGKVGGIGFCWGGSMADLAACHGLVDAGVSYYGRMTVEWLDLQPACPMLYHYGDRDALIPADVIEQIRRKRNGQVHVWGNADHGFCCEDRPQYHATAAAQSMQVTLEFLEIHLGK